MKLRKILAMVLVACATSVTGAHAAALIVNGDFETGDFTGWTPDPTPSFLQYVSGAQPHSGSFAAQIAGFSSDPDTLSQTVADTFGASYQLSFWRYIADGRPDNSLDVTWNGVSVFSELDPGSGDYNVYQQFTATVTGTGSDQLVFTAANDPSVTYLDDVSLTELETLPIPEPATWAMLMLGVLSLGFMVRRRERH